MSLSPSKNKENSLDSSSQKTKNTILLKVLSLAIVPFIGLIFILFISQSAFKKIEKLDKESQILIRKNAVYDKMGETVTALKYYLKTKDFINPAPYISRLKQGIRSSNSTLNPQYGQLATDFLEVQNQTRLLKTLSNKHLVLSQKDPRDQERLNWVISQQKEQRDRLLNAVNQLEKSRVIAETYQKDLKEAKRIESQSLGANTFFFLILVATIIMGLVIFAHLFMGRLISKPLRDIKEKMASLNKGQFYGNETEVHPNNEFGDIARLLGDFKENAQNIRRLQNHLKETIQNSTQSSKAKANILAKMGHDIKSPLNKMMGATENISNGMKGPTDKIDIEQLRADIDSISNMGQGLISMVDSVIDLTEAEADDTLRIESFNVREEVQRMLPTLELDILKNKNKLKVHCPDASLLMMSDPKRLMGVLKNLIKNAAQATSDGQITLDILGATLGDTQAIQFNVQDTGVGLDSARIKDLNNTAFQDEASIYNIANIGDKNRGAGLGLILVKKGCKDLLGQLFAKKNERKGTKITLTLPSDYKSAKNKQDKMSLSPIAEAV